MPDPEPSRHVWTRLDGLALLVSMLVGVFLAIEPHLATWVKYGTLDYLADGDDVFYMATARAPYHGETVVRDPFCRRSERVPSLYSWMQFVPLANLTRASGLPPLRILLVWRAVGGFLLGSSLFLLFRRLLAANRHATAWALGCSLVCLGDAGFITGRVLVQNVALLTQMRAGTTFLTKADALPQYRVVTPLLNLPILLLTVASVSPVARSKFRWLLTGIVGLGMCFQLYFFFWTALVLSLVVLLVGTLARGWRRPEARRSAATLAIILAGGTALGGSQVYRNAQTFADPSYKPILTRLNRGRELTRDDPSRTMYLKNSWFWAKLALGTAIILRFRLVGFGMLWCLAVAAFGLTNSALVTGLEFDNFHWVYAYAPAEEILLLGALSQWFDRLPDSARRWLPALWALPMALVLSAAVWRPFEALHAPEAIRNSRAIDELRPFRSTLARLTPESVLAGPWESNIAILTSRCAQLYQHPYTAHSSVISEASVNERHALNGWLIGLEPSSYRTWVSETRTSLFPQPRAESDAVRSRCVEIFDTLVRGKGSKLIERYQPNYLLVRAVDPTPQRAGPWSLVQKTAGWALWTRQAAPVKNDTTSGFKNQGPR